MDKNKQIAEEILRIGDETFEKLKTLKIPPYPKYYHDTFLDILQEPKNSDIFNLSRRYKYLFTNEDLDPVLKEACFDFAKESLMEFEKSNQNIKNISNENVVDIEEISQEPKKIGTAKIINSFANFQNQIFKELKNADNTISRLKLEIERLERESNIDPLTKVYNRRVLIKDLEDILKAGKTKDLDMQLIIFDADDFKKINDEYGHIAGDKTLIFITKLIQNSIRRGTRVYRYGGEEFIVILNRSTKEDALKTAERIIQTADKSKLLYKGNSIHLTLSAGISLHKTGDDAESLIERTDKALYKAKSDGKNCYRLGE